MHKLLIIASIALIIGTCGTVLAQQDDITLCGPPPPPDVTKEISEDKKADLQGQAQALTKYLGSAELGGRIESERKTIYQTTNSQKPFGKTDIWCMLHVW